MISTTTCDVHVVDPYDLLCAAQTVVQQWATDRYGPSPARIVLSPHRDQPGRSNLYVQVGAYSDGWRPSDLPRDWEDGARAILGLPPEEEEPPLDGLDAIRARLICLESTIRQGRAEDARYTASHVRSSLEEVLGLLDALEQAAGPSGEVRAGNDLVIRREAERAMGLRAPLTEEDRATMMAEVDGVPTGWATGLLGVRDRLLAYLDEPGARMGRDRWCCEASRCAYQMRRYGAPEAEIAPLVAGIERVEREQAAAGPVAPVSAKGGAR